MLIGLSFAVAPGEGWYVPVAESDEELAKTAKLREEDEEHRSGPGSEPDLFSAGGAKKMSGKRRCRT